jgi:EpsI family protein
MMANHPVPRLLVVIACLATTNIALGMAMRTDTVPPRQPLSAFPEVLGEWHGGANAPFEPKIMAALRVDDFVNRRYRDAAGRSIMLYIGYYAHQQVGETAHSPLNCLPGNGWEPTKMGAVDLVTTTAATGTHTYRVSRYVVQKGIDRQIVMFWYQSNGRVIANEYATKFYIMLDALRLNRTDGAIVRVTAPIDRIQGSEAASERLAVSFIQTMFPNLDQFLPR